MENTGVRSMAWRWCSALALCMAGFAAQARDNGPASVAFWYADNPPLPELAQFEWAVVEPGHLTAADVNTLRRLGSQPFAYLSIGEFDGDRAALQRNALTQAASTMRNQAWNSQVMDLTTQAWREHLFKRAAELKAQGYAGLFLDTLDSFQLLPKADQEAQRKALASLLRELHSRQPQLKLFFNRGFEVLGELDGVASAVAVESIHAGWDPGAKRYRPVPADDQQWLEGKLKPLRDKHIPLVAIDYLPTERRDEARKLAKQLSQEGFTPVISTPDLDGMSLSTVEVQPRRIAMLYDPREGELTENPGHLFLGGLLEYLGYRVDYLPTDEALPQHRFDGLYAGVVLWMTNGVPEDSAAFYTWLNKRLDEQVPLAIFAGLPIEDGALLQRLGLSERAPGKTGPLQVVSQDDSLVGKFEAPLVPRSRGLTLVSAMPDGPTPGLVLSDGQNRTYTPIVTAQWGGMALAPYVIESNAERSRWVLDPFAFVQKALRLPMQPRPDTTTENGRRIATVHIDGDGFPSRAEIPGTPYSGRVVLDDFIRANPYLTSVSIIEGETSPKGMFPYLANELEPLAREVLADPKVEVATHTYSHPFFLQPEKTVKRDDFHAEYGLHLKIPGYDKLDFRREIVGSRDYINSRLTTPQKPVKMVFWPGDALPSGDTIKIAYDAGLANVNGGQTIMTNANPSLTGLSPLLRPTSGGLQYYAPIINENMYTNLWKGPYYGFRDVIDTFQLTDKPRRLRGLHLYYHFYSGTKEASIKVMADIYKHMNAQQPISLWMTDYLPRLHGLYQSSLARTADGSWQVRGMDGLRTLRLDALQGWPDLGRSQGVAGVRDLPQGRYVHLSDDHARLVLRADRDPRPALEEANLPLTGWRYLNDQQVSFGFTGHTDLQFSVRSAGACSVQVNGKQFTGKSAQGLWHFQLPYRQVSDAKLSCN